jgi:hypothetical protein
MATAAAAVFLTIVMVGATISWLRGDSATRRQWTRRALHTTDAEDNAKPNRVRLFAVLSAIAAGAAVYVGVTVRPPWFAALCCYDCAMASLWWLVIALNGHRQQSQPR